MATSKLQRIVGALLDKEFPQFKIRENYRPDWLASSNYTLLELDFYIEEINIAFEIQGEQHVRFIPLFHKDDKGYRKRLQYDREKKHLCDGRGVRLIEIYTETDAIIAVKEIKEQIKPAEDSSYQDYGSGSRDEALDFYRRRREKADTNKKRVEIAKRNTIAKVGAWPPKKN